uniref:Uncharacterized protein n=1 Tax=uncultured nuHF1 cluster bacterium HF0130_31E21 TaxID=710728 RepID=E0XTK0_9BACT|nr:hypothetical protein [uncultured nuHF1 cluster bacterium HF0130_31E21]
MVIISFAVKRFLLCCNFKYFYNFYWFCDFARSLNELTLIEVPMNQRWLYECFVTMIFGLLAVFFRVLSIIFQVWIM